MMKLSDAIRLGAMLHPQCFGVPFKHDASGNVVASCALGAAEMAGHHEHKYTTALATRAVCPACAFDYYLNVVIAHLNDDHGWTREAIADWIDTREPSCDTPTVLCVSRKGV